MHVIPAVDMLGGRCVRLFQGDYGQSKTYGWRPEEAAAAWAAAGARWLHLVDLDGARAGRPVNLEAVRAIRSATDVPCEFGGGVRSPADAEAVFEAGANRVILGTAACEDPALVAELLLRHGPDRVAVGLDARKGKVAVKGWTVDSGLDVLDLAAAFAARGVRRFIHTDIARDGALAGPNTEAVAELCRRVPGALVVASGGVGRAEDVRALARAAAGLPNLEAVIVGKALYEGKATLQELMAACAP